MDKDQLEDQIDNYLLDRLTEADRVDFEAAVAGDPALAEALELQRQMVGAVQMEAEIEFRGELNDIHDTHFSTTSPRVKRQIWPWYIAAAAILVIGLFIFLKPPPSTPDSLYAEFFSPYPSNLIQRGATDDFAAAVSAYVKGDYAVAAPLFTGLALQYPSDIRLGLYEGISQMGLGKWAKAAASFEKILQQPTSLVHDHARWYLALTNIARGELAGATAALEVLVGDEGADHHKEAGLLLEELE